MITELNERAQTVLRHIVDSYMETGEPVGSRTLSQLSALNLSPATIRNVMADLEEEGLLFAPHTSAGRMPTQRGMRLYVDGLMQIGDLSETERATIETQCQTRGETVNQALERASAMLSGLSAAAGLVVAPKTDKPIRQIQFMPLEPGKILAILVMQDNMVENRVIETPYDMPQATLTQAANYLNDRMAGRDLLDAQRRINQEIAENKAQLDALTTDLVKRGLALAPIAQTDGHIIIRGQSKLLQDVRAVADLERARRLLEVLEEQDMMLKLLDATQGANGAQVFIGAENGLFNHAGWSMVVSPYRAPDQKIIGAIGVIGPMRLNYGRIIPVVDYTAKVMSRLIGG